jgi:hypothetical protein
MRRAIFDALRFDCHGVPSRAGCEQVDCISLDHEFRLNGGSLFGSRTIGLLVMSQ